MFIGSVTSLEPIFPPVGRLVCLSFCHNFLNKRAALHFQARPIGALFFLPDVIGAVVVVSNLQDKT